MCMLCVMEPGKVPTRDELENTALNNPHGFGYAIHVGDAIINNRNMNADMMISEFLAVRETFKDGYAIWHARYATHGSSTLDNCHPFKVGKDERTYLAHNGVLDVMIPKDDHRSDTRVFAESILPAMGGSKVLDDPYVFDMLETYTKGSKVAVLTCNPVNKYPVYILNEHLGKWDDGVWWSNDTHKLYDYSSYYTIGKKSPSSLDPITDDEHLFDWETSCQMCQVVYDEDMRDKVWAYGACPMCDSCVGCLTFAGDCLCYRPGYSYGTGVK